MPNYITIKNRSVDERPREKLVKNGKHTLSNSELLGILISTGTKNRSAIDLSRDILQTANNNLNELAKFTIADLCKINGIGPAKAITILSAIELGGRRNAEGALEIKSVKSSAHAYQYVAHKLADKSHEEFWIIFLNRANKIMSDLCISQGGLSSTTVDPKIVFKHAIERGASSIILCHNHPSGNLKPSLADIKLTKKIVSSGAILDIKVLDHLIVSSGEYFSFVDEGQFPEP